VLSARNGLLDAILIDSLSKGMRQLNGVYTQAGKTHKIRRSQLP